MEAKAKRRLKSGKEFDKYFPATGLERQETIIKQSGDVFATLRFMGDIATKHRAQTAQIAPLLQGKNLEETCRNIFDFVYGHIQYTEDTPGVEQLRRPLRTWHDRNAGVDCDCYSIFISSILLNLGIPHKFRMTKYKNDWQHVYLIVPKNRLSSQYYTLDCVVDSFDYEVPFTEKFDTQLMQIAELSGITDHPSTKPLIPFGHEFNGFGRVSLGATSAPVDIVQDYWERTKRHLETSKAIILSSPALKEDKDFLLFAKQIQYFFNNWDDVNARQIALQQLVDAESMPLNGLGKTWFGKVFSKIADGAKAVATGVSNAAQYTGDKIADAAKATATGIKNAAEWTGDKLEDVGKAIVKYNPLSIAIRNGLLLAFKINLFGMSERLGYGYWTEQQAQANGLNVTEWRKLKGVLNKVINIHEGLQGDLDSLQKNIEQGWDYGTKKHGLPRGNGSLSINFAGLGQLGTGEPVTTSAIAAAMPVIATVTALLTAVGGLYMAFKPAKEYPTEVPANYTPPTSEAEYLANQAKFDNPTPTESSFPMLPVLGLALLLGGYLLTDKSE